MLPNSRVFRSGVFGFGQERPSRSMYALSGCLVQVLRICCTESEELGRTGVHAMCLSCKKSGVGIVANSARGFVRIFRYFLKEVRVLEENDCVEKNVCSGTVLKGSMLYYEGA
jgi:hypothetical protein